MMNYDRTPNSIQNMQVRSLKIQWTLCIWLSGNSNGDHNHLLSLHTIPHSGSKWFYLAQKTSLISIPSFHLSFSPNSTIHPNSIPWTILLCHIQHFSTTWLHLQYEHFIMGHGFGKSLQWFSDWSCFLIGIWYSYQAEMIPHNFMLHYENNDGYNLIWINSTQTIFKLFWHFSEGGRGEANIQSNDFYFVCASSPAHK